MRAGNAMVVAAVRGWLGTPYRHQASLRGAGCDCLGLVRGVWRDIIGAEPEAVPSYTADWLEPSGSEELWAAADRWLSPCAPRSAIAPGEVLLFRMHRRTVAKHLGIVTEAGDHGRFVHAYSGHGVVETTLSQPWRDRIVARFQFPKG